MQQENTAGAENEVHEEQAGIEALGELLDLDEPAPEGEGESNGAGASKEDDEGGSRKASPKKFNDLAEALGMELDDLYKLEIQTSEDGEPITIEGLKDFHAEQDTLALQQIEFEERRAEQEAALMQAQTELREIMQALPKNAIKPEILEQVRAKHEATVEVEQKRTLEVIPEWKDEKTRTKELTGIAEHLKQFGFPVDYLKNVVDHRQLKFMRESWLREQRIKRALERVKAGKPNSSGRIKPTDKPGKKAPVSNVQRGSSPNKLHAVFSNLD